jgi:hypothetical protein
MAAAALLVAGTASATSLSLKYLGAASGYQTLAILESPVTPVTGATPTSVFAGAFKMRDTTANSAFGDFVAWSLDISHWLGTSGNYPYESTTTPFSNSYGLDAAQQARVQGFFDANYESGLETKKNQSAGFQMGLWEVLYDDDYSLTNNDTNMNHEFRGAAGNSNAATAFGYALDYLTNASGYGAGPRRWNLMFLESKSIHARQNLVTVSPVPVPAAGLLLFAGLAGLGMVVRRRKG